MGQHPVDASSPADSSGEAAEVLLLRLWTAAEIFMERLSATDAPQRLAVLQRAAAKFAAVSASLNVSGTKSAAALSAASAAFADQLQQPLTADLLDTRNQLLTFVSASSALSSLVSADPILSDVLLPALTALGATSGDSAAPGDIATVWRGAHTKARRWQAARAAATFSARLHAVQEDAATAVQARVDSPLQLAHWRHTQPQVTIRIAVSAARSRICDCSVNCTN